jgi:lipopolysaccharide transport system ATP-binding protein
LLQNNITSEAENLNPAKRVILQDIVVNGVNSVARAYGFKNWFLRNHKEKRTDVIIPILRGISLELHDGERVGIIGRNGSGKSSLLKVIAGIYPPHGGKLIVNGRVAPVIEMGIGFDPELTGKQNIKLGLLYTNRLSEYSKELEEQIIEFSELGEKIDVPLKYYSSGMQARLGFSVTVFQNPEILLLDEALAAGDSNFLEKAKTKMLEKFHSASLSIFVSHDDSFIEKFCTRCIWMENGKIIADGKTKDIIPQYKNSGKTSAQPIISAGENHVS